MKKDYENMSRKELTEIKAKVDFWLEQDSNKHDYKNSSYVELFMSSLTDCFLKRLIKRPPPISAIKASRTGAISLTKLNKAISSLNNWSSIALGHNPSRIEKYKIYTLVCELTCDFLQGANIPLSFKTVVNSYEKFPSLLNQAFPGYIESGLFKVILLSKEQKISDEDLL